MNSINIRRASDTIPPPQKTSTVVGKRKYSMVKKENTSEVKKYRRINKEGTRIFQKKP